MLSPFLCIIRTRIRGNIHLIKHHQPLQHLQVILILAFHQLLGLYLSLCLFLHQNIFWSGSFRKQLKAHGSFACTHSQIVHSIRLCSSALSLDSKHQWSSNIQLHYHIVQLSECPTINLSLRRGDYLKQIVKPRKKLILTDKEGWIHDSDLITVAYHRCNNLTL